MPNVKTAVSIDAALFEQVEALARDLHTSRSHVFALALAEFVRRHESRQLLERIDAAYADEPDDAERTRAAELRRAHRQIVEGEW